MSQNSKRFWKIISVLNFFVFVFFVSPNIIHASGAVLDNPSDIYVSGNYAYVVSGGYANALEIIDISNPSMPIHKGSISHRNGGTEMFTPRSIFVKDNYAYIVSLSNALEIINISDPTNPIHTSTLFNGDSGTQIVNPVDIFVSGNYAYIANRGSQNLEIVDVSDPVNPVHVSSKSFGIFAVPYSINVVGDYAYLTLGVYGGSGGSLEILNISNPALPTIVGSIWDGEGGASISNSTAVVVNNYAYLNSLGANTLEILDVSDPINPRHAGKISNIDLGMGSLFSPKATYVSNNTAYTISFYDDKFISINVNDKTNPAHLSTLSNGENDASLLTPESVYVSGNYAYVVSSGSDALEVIDITNPSRPLHKSKLLNGEVAGTPAPNICTTDCFSNVLFLPGVMGSRLYNSSEQELWVSSDDSRHRELSLDSSGKSIDSSVHTKDDTQNNGEIDETGLVDDVYSANIYQSFISDLHKWKDQEHIINDYAFIPYDWRLSLDDIITNGKSNNDNLSYSNSQNFSDSFILQKLQTLQNNSKSGNVTIIAHSNGGLVAKALIQKLKDTNNPLYNKIDKVILVAVPQVGTPDAIASLLHGSKLGAAGFIMGNKRSRQLSENMPAVYNLLPSTNYFTIIDPAFAIDKVVSFKDDPFFTPEISQYGIFVSNENELKNYILGTDNRPKPSFEDTATPNIGNSNLYTQAEQMHQILDNWQPSSDTKIIEVAGWGEETLAGISYEPIRDTDTRWSYKPNYVVDGDGTVVVPSALWMPVSPNVERWWVDLPTYDTIFNLERVHKDIFEVSNLLDFIKSKVKNETDFSDPDNVVVNNTSSLITNGSRLHFTLHSPLTLGILDSQGRYTGLDPASKQVKEEIPGVNYDQIGEVQFLSIPEGLSYTVKMSGYDNGFFTLDMEKQTGNVVSDTTSFSGIPSTTSTQASINISPDTQVANTVLQIDQNGDGAVDKTMNSTLGGVTVYDTTPPELQVTFDINVRDVVFRAIDDLGPNPRIEISKSSITLKDNADNTTIIPFQKLKDLPTRTRLVYNKIIRNGVITTLPNTNIVYDWQEKKNVLIDLDTKVVERGVEKYIFNYRKANSTTTIKEKKGKTVNTTTKNGFVVVTVKTKSDGLEVNY